jgi:Tol biopolymer transport system component
MKVRTFHSLSVLALLTVVSGFTLACSMVTRLFERGGATPYKAVTAGLIAYTGTDGNIYTIDRDGKNQKAITQDAILGPGGIRRIYNYPTWAPDGIHLAFAEVDATVTPSPQASLLSMDVKVGKPVVTFSSNSYIPFYLFWSPDNKKISFLSTDITGGDLEMYIATADGSESHLVGTGQPFYWDWSPKGDEIIIHTGGATTDNPAAHLAFNTMYKPYNSVDIDLRPSLFQAPAWSPQGELIALAVDTDAGEALVLKERGSGKSHTLVSVVGPVAFAWSPDGRRLAYMVSSQDGSGQAYNNLYIIDPSQPKETKLVATAAIVGFFWSPDGRQLAIFEPVFPSPGGASFDMVQQPPTDYVDLKVIDLDTGNTRHLTTFTPTNSFLNLLPFFDQYHRSLTLWSPDSRKLVIAAVDGPDPGIYVIDTVSGDKTRVASGDLAVWSWK